MRIASIGLAFVLVLLCAGGGDRTANSSTENPKGARVDNRRVTHNDAGPSSSPERTKESLSETLAQQPSGFPFAWFPSRDTFTTWENEPFLVLVSVDCDSGSQSDAKIELLDPAPSFVQLSPICFREGLASALVTVAPGEGDAGKHIVKVKAIPCRGPGGVITLTIKVKKAR